MKHAEEHDTLINGDTESGKFEGEGIVLWCSDELHCTATIWKTLVGHLGSIDGNERVTNCGMCVCMYKYPH